jgi:hypothetical protein
MVQNGVKLPFRNQVVLVQQEAVGVFGLNLWFRVRDVSRFYSTIPLQPRIYTLAVGLESS